MWLDGGQERSLGPSRIGPDFGDHLVGESLGPGVVCSTHFVERGTVFTVAVARVGRLEFLREIGLLRGEVLADSDPVGRARHGQAKRVVLNRLNVLRHCRELGLAHEQIAMHQGKPV